MNIVLNYYKKKKKKKKKKIKAKRYEKKNDWGVKN